MQQNKKNTPYVGIAFELFFYRVLKRGLIEMFAENTSEMVFFSSEAFIFSGKFLYREIKDKKRNKLKKMYKYQNKF